MRNFFKSVKFKICLCVLAAALLGVFIAAVSGSGTSPLTNAINIVMTPLNNAAGALSEKLSGFNAGFVSSSKYLEEIESLKKEIESYKEQLVDYEKLQQKLSSYEEFLEVKSENPDFSFTPATIIMRDPLDVYSSFTINKGSADGIEIDMPVIYGKNLLGVVREVGTTSSVVYSLFDPEVSVAVYEIRTRENCYTESDNISASEGYIKLMGLSRTTPVVSGGVVCSSGIGGIYPRDLIVGSVSEVINSESDISAYALVAPSADYSSLIDVFVITDFEGKAK